MARPIKYDWDRILPQTGASWFFPYEDRNTVRASSATWAKARGKKVKTKRASNIDLNTGDISFMLEVTLVA